VIYHTPALHVDAMPATDSHQPIAYHDAVARAFSLSAPLYDADQISNPIARWTRARNLALLSSLFKPGDRVLELGCGTGVEAIYLARRGVTVVATDPAQAMIAEVQSKLAEGGSAHDVAGRITPLVLAARDVWLLIESYGPQAFDGAYSSFGPLNCEPDLAPVADALAALVRPGGRVLISVINRYCLWEAAWYLATGKPRVAFRRWGGRAGATVRADWPHEKITIFYRTPGSMRRAFGAHFRLERTLALPWLLPPQYLAGLVRRSPRLFRWLARVDRALAGTWPFHSLGDHCVLVLSRTPPTNAGSQRTIGEGGSP
jgi:SAM-dependent methyltransferase